MVKYSLYLPISISVSFRVLAKLLLSLSQSLKQAKPLVFCPQN